MQIQYKILYMNMGQPSHLKHQWGIFIHVSMGLLYQNEE
jgi:hypothetical protein